MRKKGLIVAMSALLLMTTGCVKAPKLENGQEVIAEMEGKQYTADDLYNELKESYGTTALVNMIDEYIVSKELTDTKDAKVKAEAYIKQMREYYESQGQTWSDVLTKNGYTDATLLEEYTLNYAKQTVAENYYKNNVTDDEINKYYENDIIGDITAKHILITSKATDKMTDDEKKAKDAEALAKANEVISKLNNSEDFAKLAKEYSDDESASEGGNLAPFNKQSNYEEAFINAAVNLNKDEYTKTAVKTKYGYHIIYIVNKAEKPKLDDVKSTIITNIAQSKMDANENYFYTAWKEIRKNYKLNFHDTVINEKYDQTMSKY